ncbi:hypothetical protein CKAN_01217700 [Cinnamomum micranthum f. kanehirae]|uniref:Chromo domain-containing protein n=1 Tax=Cinnamomum micranthum f. kanehirae TaxID=337451 RepID=A0A443NY53_9MAGN|nr:hypothetical protein CKAN_01217700 [Cinnamomum micranthum f. kanehirae]
MKKWTDHKRRPLEFKEGDKVMLKLPAWLKKIHPVFHVSHLKPYHEDMEDPSRCFSPYTPAIIIEIGDKEVESILAKCEVHQEGGLELKEYLVKWQGLLARKASWEPVDGL